jgi:tetratricopeptide (TPR) repeat protein
MVTTTRQVSAGRPDDRPSRSASWPIRSGPLPPLADCFSPRPETGSGAASAVAPGATAVLTQPAPPGRAGRHSLDALGGTGKTQLAAAIALSIWRSRRVDLLAWVPAASRDAVLTGYAQVLTAAGIPGADADMDATAASFLAWLATTGRPWLVILDDLADLADLDGLWPRGPAGLVLVTTRLPAAAMHGPGLRVFEVGAFSPREAMSYLTARLYDPGMRTGALDLATDLGCLPLGLAQASAVIADSPIDCRRYRAQFAERQKSVAEANHHAATVAVTWSLSLDRADALAPPGTAGRALALLALLDPAGVPGAVLTSQAACDYICGRGATGGRADGSEIRTVFDSLSRSGLVTIDPESASRTIRMHGLVQATIRQVIPPAALKQVSAAAASALLQAWAPDDPEPLLAQAMRECTASLHRAAAELLWATEAHSVLLRAGRSLDSAGLTGMAISYWQAMIDTGSRILGEGHITVLQARDHLAGAYLTAGRIADAISTHEQSLAARAQALGPDHPDTLAARGTFARACLAAGRAADAIPLCERAAADRERVLGPDHPATVTARGDLAAAYLSAGQPQPAIAILEHVYRDQAASLGPDHPETLTACAELAAALHSAGRPKDAIPLYERALAARERAQGATHPDTMTTRASLAYAYRSADRMKQALPVYERTLADRERVLGPDHPDTLTSLANLASAYHTAHKLKQALPLYEEALSRRERQDGLEHPDTLVARGNLASAYHSAGRLAQAIPLYEQTLQDYERVMGQDHTSTLTARANVASAYHTVGRRTEAIAFFERTLADCERLLPPGHPMTQTIRENLQAAT